MEDGHSDKDKGKALKGLRTVNCLLWYLAIEPGRRERGEARDRDRQGGSKGGLVDTSSISYSIVW